ncbi:MAG: hypothetical protein COA74_14725 [Gammaproteobacteria bacterium]|nr:MAG: hypothetical protein COA74_14725 [Gammaproteobacteria bacterium]
MPDNKIFLPTTVKDEAFERIQEIAKKDTVRVEILDHALDRMMQREITNRQIFSTLRNGSLIEGPFWCTEKERGWKCKISHVVAGINIIVIAKLVERESEHCLVITVWS